MEGVGRGLIGAFLLLALVSCTPWRDTYLTEGVNRATQDDVTRKLGPPHFQRELTGGGTVWTYQQRHVSFFEAGTRTTGHSYCLEYVLVFDRERVLREWRTQDC